MPRYPDQDGTITAMPGLMSRYDVMRTCAAAGGDRFAVYDLENHHGTPVYVHAKVVVVDDVWAMIGSDNLNRRSWSHDSELSIAVLDAELDGYGRRRCAGWSMTRTAAPGAIVSAAGSGQRRAGGGSAESQPVERAARRPACRRRTAKITAMLPASQAVPKSQPPTTSAGQCTPSQTLDQPTAAA